MRADESALKGWVRCNALSLALAGLFAVSTIAQIAFGFAAYNEDRQRDGAGPLVLVEYLRSGHFLEAVFENWESEFLQMAVFVLLSVKLKQKGSAESKPLDEPFESDEDPRLHRHEPESPWPVKRGGVVLRLYENSLALAFFLLFALSLVLHAIGGLLKTNAENAIRGRAPETFWDYVMSSQFWFESFQNWQSEFLAVFAIVVLTIFLRQRGSPQSKPVSAPHSSTGGA
jgi:hypothetical protein